MGISIVLRAGVIVLGCWAFTLSSIAQNAPAPGGLVMGEAGWRRDATNRVLPMFPARSLAAARQGVTVAYVVSKPDGTMGRVEVLEAPDAAMGASVQRALMMWRLAPVPPDRGVIRHFEGRITFYFKIVKGRGLVLNPEQMDGNQDVWEAWYGRAAGPASPGGPNPTRGPAAAIKEIDADEAARLVRDRDAVIVDVRERDEFARSHTRGATIMPVGEILVRSRAEMSVLRPIIIDCSQGERAWCKVGAGLFVKRGFHVVLTLVP